MKMNERVCRTLREGNGIHNHLTTTEDSSEKPFNRKGPNPVAASAALFLASVATASRAPGQRLLNDYHLLRLRKLA